MSRFRMRAKGSGTQGKAEPIPAALPVHPSEGATTRRGFIGWLGAGAVALGIGLPAALSVRSVVPNALYEEPRQLKLGPLDSFADGSTFVAAKRLFIFREKNILYCVSAICTHLGCTVQLVNMKEAAGGFEFHCPCHGSKFRADGTNFAGPAPKPLMYYKLSVTPDDGQLMADLSQPAGKGWRLTV